MEPSKVPEKLESKIDPKILVAILGIVILFQILIYAVKDTENAHIVTGLITTLNPIASSIMGIFVTQKYWKSQIFGKAYLALTIGLFMNFLGALFFYLYSVTNLEILFSIGDVFYLSFYPFTLYHLVKNINFFKPKQMRYLNYLPPLTFMILIVSYAMIKFQITGEVNYEFIYGLAYVIGSSAIFSFAIVGMLIFRHGVLGTTWLVLVVGITLTTIGDQWYSYLTTISVYDLTHPVNLLWYGGYMVITYSLYKHRKTI